MMEAIQIKVNGYKVDIIVNKLTKDELIWSVFDVDTDHNDFFDELLHEQYQDEIDSKVITEMDKIKADKTTEKRHSNLSIDELTERKQGLGIL